jgi:Uma2 family endonuclease
MELIRGEIVPMPSEHDLHGRARARLIRLFNLFLGDEWFIATELSLFLADDIEFKPDLHVFDTQLKSHDVTGPDVKLAVELTASSHRRDFELKVPLYAECGVGELWIFDLDAKTVTTFREPREGRYTRRDLFDADQSLSPLAFPQVKLRLRDLL